MPPPTRLPRGGRLRRGLNGIPYKAQSPGGKAEPGGVGGLCPLCSGRLPLAAAPRLLPGDGMGVPAARSGLRRAGGGPSEAVPSAGQRRARGERGSGPSHTRPAVPPPQQALPAAPGAGPPAAGLAPCREPPSPGRRPGSPQVTPRLPRGLLCRAGAALGAVHRPRAPHSRRRVRLPTRARSGTGTESPPGALLAPRALQHLPEPSRRGGPVPRSEPSPGDPAAGPGGEQKRHRGPFPSLPFPRHTRLCRENPHGVGGTGHPAPP